jgi:kynureninase
MAVLFAKPVRPIFTALEHRGCIGDLREPNVLRIAPTPLYNTFADVFKYVQIV